MIACLVDNGHILTRSRLELTSFVSFNSCCSPFQTEDHGTTNAFIVAMDSQFQLGNSTTHSRNNTKMETKGRSSGLAQIWKLWRHCCCRFGTYPLLVAPIVTVSCLLDIYSSLDCEFLKVNVGFLPSNQAWNQTTATLGLFQFQVEQEPDLWGELLVEGCNRYSDEFQTQFVDRDRTWEVTQVVAYISGISGILATVRIIVLGTISCF
jgi:hypothetical protein